MYFNYSPLSLGDPRDFIKLHVQYYRLFSAVSLLLNTKAGFIVNIDLLRTD